MTYNPQCDYCENCNQHGHTAEECTGVTARPDEGDKFLDERLDRAEKFARMANALFDGEVVCAGLLVDFADLELKLSNGLISVLGEKLAAERTRREKAEAILNQCDNDTQYTCIGCFSTMMKVNFYRETYPEDKEVKATFSDDFSGGNHALLHGTEDKQ